MVRKKAYVAMDADSLLRLTYSVMTARYKNERTLKRRIVESGLIEILVTNHILDEIRKNIIKVLRSTNLRKHGWNEPPESVAKRFENELENLIDAGVIVNVEQPYGKYASQYYAVINRPSRRVLYNYLGGLKDCMSRSKCADNLEKDIPVAESFLLAYDVAAAIPLKSRAGISTPPFVAVTFDNDFICVMSNCLGRLGIGDKLILVRYDVFWKQFENWFNSGVVFTYSDWCVHSKCL